MSLSLTLIKNEKSKALCKDKDQVLLVFKITI